MPDRRPHLKTPPLREAITFTLPGASVLSGLSVATLRRRAKDDKGPEDATTSTQVLEMYRSQASVSNMGGAVDFGEDESD